MIIVFFHPCSLGLYPVTQLQTNLPSFIIFYCQALDSGKEIRVVFCDVSKAFDRVWHKGLLCKLSAVCISGSLLSWFESYLSERRQLVILLEILSTVNEHLIKSVNLSERRNVVELYAHGVPPHRYLLPVPPYMYAPDE